MADIKTLAKVADVELANAFNLSAGKLVEMMGIAEPIAAKPGETLHQYKVTGILSSASYTEGEEIPVSTYSREKVSDIPMELKPYRKQTTLQEVQKRGYSEAVDQTDAKMVSDIQFGIKKSFVTALETGIGTAEGDNLVAAAANAWAALQNKAEELGFGDVTPVFFANPADFAKCIGSSEVFSAFGMPAILNWSGLGTLISTSAVTAGNVDCCAAQNLKAYYIDANEAPIAEFTTDESGYVAVAHSFELRDLCYDTVAWTALTIFPEYVELVVKATITPGA